MPNALYPVTLKFRDAKGLTASVKFILDEATLAAAVTDSQALTAAAAALSECYLQSVRGPAAQAEGLMERGTAATYGTAEDKVMLMYQDVVGSYHRYQIPGPNLNAGGAPLLLADNYTVDATNAAVVAFNALMVAGPVRSLSAFALSSFIGGWIRRKKLKRRLNGITLDPTLTVPAL